MKYKFLLFDLDNTILNFDKSEEIALRKTLKQHKIKPTSRMISYYRNINESLWKSFEQGHIAKEEIVKLRFKTFFDLFNFNFDSSSFNNIYVNNLKKESHTIKGAKKLLKKLSQDFDIYIVTNGVKEIAESRIELSGLSPYINKTFVSEVIGSNKPKLSYYQYVFNNIPNFEKDKAITIGDSLSSDILGGNNANIKTVWFNYINQEINPNILADYEISKLKQLYKILY